MINPEDAVIVFVDLQDNIISSSCSSSDDSEDELNNILDENENHRCVRRIPRVHNFIVNVIMMYSEEDFRENFRLRRETLNYLLFLIRRDLEGDEYCGFGRRRICPEKQLYIALYILGTPDSYRSVKTKFNVGKATAWRSVKQVVKAICDLRNYFIQWTSRRVAQETFRAIHQKYGFPGVIGAIDGTHIRIAAPKNDANCYINRKGVNSIQLQIVCNSELEFIHCYAGLP